MSFNLATKVNNLALIVQALSLSGITNPFQQDVNGNGFDITNLGGIEALTISANGMTIGGTDLVDYIRSQFTTAGALDYNPLTGLLTGITIDNVGHNVALSLSGTVLSADTTSSGSKWTDTGTNNIYNNNITGNVGIGTTTPTHKLDVQGDIYSSDIIRTEGGLNITGSASFNSGLTISGGALEASSGLIITGASTFTYKMALLSGLNVTGSASFNTGLTISGGALKSSSGLVITGSSTFVDKLALLGGLNVTGTVSFNNGLTITGGSVNTIGLITTGNATFTNNVLVGAGIGVGVAPLGGAHKINTKGRIRATAYDAVDTSGVIETQSNNGYINYLYTADSGKAYYTGSTENLNIQIGLSANTNFQVDGSSVHNAGIYVVGGSEINGTLLVYNNFRVLNSATFTTSYAEIGVPIRGHQGLYITGIAGQTNRIYTGGLTVTGSASFNNGLTITGGALNVIGMTSLGDITLARNNTALTGRLLTFTFGTANAGVQAQGIEFRDLTTNAQQCGLYGGQNTLRFYSGGTEKMAIGSNVSFSAMPLLNSNPITTDNIAEGSSNWYYTETRFNNSLFFKTTDDLAQGTTNKYFSNALARGALSAVAPISYDSTNGIISLPTALEMTEWSRRVNNSANPTISYYKIASLNTNTGGDGSVIVRGSIGGWEANTQAIIEFAVSVRNSRIVWGSCNMSSTSFTMSQLIGRLDFGLYLTTLTGIYDLYLILKNNTYQAFDFTVQRGGTQLTLFNPTTTISPTPSGGSFEIASIVPNLNNYTIGGNVGFGTVTPNAKLEVESNTTNGTSAIFRTNYNTDGTSSLRRTSIGQTNFRPSIQAEYYSGSWLPQNLLLNPVGSGVGVGSGVLNPLTQLEVYSDLSTRSSLNGGNLRILSYDNTNYIQSGLTYVSGSTAPLVIGSMYNGKEWGRFSADGNLGLGTATPAFKLDVIGVTETSIHCRSTSTTGYSELYMQNDNSIAGGGLVMYGSFYLGDANKRNALELSNEIGGVHISSSGNMVINTDSGTQINTRGNLSVSGNLFIGKADATAFGSALVVFNDNYRSNTSQAGVNMGYSANGFGASLGLIGTATGNCQIEFGSRTDLGVADGYIRWNNSSDTMTLGADVITFNTNPTVPHTERARFLADGRFIVNSNTAVATYAGSVLQTKGRIAIAGYDGSDVNPVIEFIDSSGAVRYFYYTGTASGSFILTGYLGLNKTATYQIDLSTDLARKLSTSTWAVTSDRRLKENIVDADLNICYNNIRKLRLRRYNYIDSFGIDDKTGKKLYEDKNQLGFIAQEVAEIYPKAVHTTDESENGGLEDQLSLDLDQLNRTLFGAVQRLMQKVEDLQEQQIKERIQYKVMEDKQTKRILQLEKVVTQHTLTLENIRKVLLTKGISV